MARLDTLKAESSPRESGRSKQAQRPNAEELRREIENEAYRLFEARGRQEGKTLEDWLRAEKNVRRRWNLSS